MFYVAEYRSPVGMLTLASQNDAVTGLWIEGQKYFGAGLRQEQIIRDRNDALKAAFCWLDRYFAKEKPTPGELLLSPQGGQFRKTVWSLLCEIPYGEVATYKEIAGKVAAQRGISSMSAQAVGGAVGHNPISIIIPCHRVIGTDKSLRGYAAGIAVKEKLLALEGIGEKINFCY